LNTLVVTPMREEMDLLLRACQDAGHASQPVNLGRLAAARLPGLELSVAVGGTGKAQFAAQTQHLLDTGGPWELAICAGAAGALSDDLMVGDVVAATVTIEHDYYNRFNSSPVPRFPGAPDALAAMRRVTAPDSSFRLRFGPIASGDEDIVEGARRAALSAATGALAVAWEGAGGARACAFSGVPFLELRGITDSADPHAPASFEANLDRAMASIAHVLLGFAAQLMSVPKRPL
jgi:adenosylhomocysteine nucleosidase